jgi:hypothetical protein
MGRLSGESACPTFCARIYVLGEAGAFACQRISYLVIAAAPTTTAASAVSTFAPASAATAATRPTAATSATTTGPAAPAFAHRPRLIHHQRTAQKVLAIAGLNGSLGFFVVAKLREPETTRLTGKLIANNLNGISLESIPREPVL